MVLVPPAGNDTDFMDAFGMAVATWGGTVRGGAHLGGEELADIETVSARLLGPDR